MGAISYVDERLVQLDMVAHGLKVRPEAVAARVEQLQSDLRKAHKKAEAATVGAGSNRIAEALHNAHELDGYRCVITRLDDLSGKDLRSVWDGIRDASDGHPVACVIASVTPDKKVALLAGATDTAVTAGFSAGALIKDIAGLVGGRGGGRPNMAQAGGVDISGIDAALEAAKQKLGI